MFFHPKHHVFADKEANENSIFRASAAFNGYFHRKHCVPNNAIVEVKITDQSGAYMAHIRGKSEKSSNKHSEKSHRFLL